MMKLIVKYTKKYVLFLITKTKSTDRVKPKN